MGTNRKLDRRSEAAAVRWLLTVVITTSLGASTSLGAWASETVTKVVAKHDETELAAPVRLCADGKPINIGDFSRYAHASPWIADIDGDQDRDLLVGDFPGFFWLFENTRDDKQPEYTSRGKLIAGGTEAKTPVY